jgi:para-nitrobenzyl esterase
VPLPAAILPRALSALTGLSPAEAARHVETYRTLRPSGTGARILADVGGDVVFRTPAVRLAEARVAGAPIFDYVLEAPTRAVGRQDATLHGAELPYLFDSLSSPSGRRLAGPDPSPSLGVALRRLWCRFIERGRPTDDPAAWPPYDAARATAVLTPDGPSIVNDFDAPRRAVWTCARSG